MNNKSVINELKLRLSHWPQLLNISGEDEYSGIIRKNILLTFSSKLLSMIISIFLIPLTLNYLNPTKYGIWLALSSIIAWIGIADLGLTHGLRNKFTEVLINKDYPKGKVYVSTTYSVLLLSLTLFSVILFLISENINLSKFLNIPLHLYPEVNLLIKFIIILFSLRLLFSLINSLLFASQKSGVVSAGEFIINLFIYLITYIITITSANSLLYLGISISLVPVVFLLAQSIYFFKNHYKEYKPDLKSINLKAAKPLFSLGAKFFIIQVSGLITFAASNIIIANIFNPVRVTEYNIGFRYYTYLLLVFTLILTPFWSIYTKAFIEKNFNWIKESLNKLRYLWMLFIPIILVMTYFSDYIYRVWVGNNIQVPFILSISLAVYVIISMWCEIYVKLILGTGKIKLLVILSLINIILPIPLSYYFSQFEYINIAGPVIATIIVLIPSAILWPIQSRKIINNTASGIWN